MANTTNFNWETPDDTDLVKDGAAAIRTLGNSIDTSFVDLKGGTTGQVLAKASNTDLDFTWSAGGDITAVTAGTGLSGGGTSGDVTLTNTVATAFDAKGDLILGTGADTFSRLAVGTNDYVLTAASGETTGVKWAAVPSSSKTWTLLNSGGTAMSGSSSVTVSSITDKENILVLVVGAGFSSTNNAVRFRINADTGSNYNVQQNSISADSSYAASSFNGYNSNTTFIPLGTTSTNSSSTVNASIVISAGKSTGIKNVAYAGGGTHASGNSHTLNSGFGIYSGSAAITSVNVYSTATFNAGTIYVYGA